jgi:hypothetical protein
MSAMDLGCVITFGRRFETVVTGQTEYQLEPTAYGFRLGARNHASGFPEGNLSHLAGRLRARNRVIASHHHRRNHRLDARMFTARVML